MRADRLVTMLLLLQSRGRMSGPELAAALEVSVRTVYRDMEALSSGGIPIYAERGAQGGFRLMDGYRLRLEALTHDEAAALPFLAMPALARDLGIEESRSAAALKLRSALPEAQRSATLQSEAEVYVDLASGLSPASRDWLRAFRSAARTRRVVVITCPQGAREEPRSLEFSPLGVVFAAGHWYAIGLLAGEVSAVRVREITRVRGTADRFEPPEGNLASWWESCRAREQGTETPRASGA